jgi:hypothetical protein
MLVVDDILLFPIKGAIWIFNEIYEAAKQELAREAEAITTELQQLYVMLEGGRITEREFDVREKELLERLESIQDRGVLIDDGDPDFDEDAEEMQ